MPLPTSPTLDETLAFVTRAHAGQVDKAGEPYVGHLVRVRERTCAWLERCPWLVPEGEREAVLHAALLHDVVEDTQTTQDDLRAMGYPEAVVARVVALTRKDGGAYGDKIRALAESEDVGAILIKLADNEDNSDPARVARLPVPAPERAARYRRSMEILRTALARASLLPSVPADRVIDALGAAPGGEIASGKFLSPESSSALAANAFGPFLADPARLPQLPNVPECAGAGSVALEAVVRFPWAGGRHPCLDVLVETETALLGIESKRYEPYRAKSAPDLSDAYDRPVWGERMGRYEAMRDDLRAGAAGFRRLDAAQLVKHAFGLRSAVHREAHEGKTPLLVYLYAEPVSWPDGAAVPREAIDEHRAEIARFADRVTGDEVRFAALSYADLLACWGASEDARLREHAGALAARFGLAP